MANGLIFLWFAWMLWIIVIFFMPKSQKRTYYASFILLIIIGSRITEVFVGYRVTLAFLILFFSCLFIHRMAKAYYQLFAAFTVSLGYAGILFWEQLMPVWLIMPRFFLMAVLLLFIVILLGKSFPVRLTIGAIGMIYGEIGYNIIMGRYGLRGTIGDLTFFDAFFSFVMFLTLFHSMSYLLEKCWFALKLPKKNKSAENISRHAIPTNKNMT